MRKVNDDALGFQRMDPLPAQIGESAFVDAGCRAANRRISKVCWGHHAYAGVEEVVQVFQLAFQRLRALGAKKSRNLSRFACGKLSSAIGPCLNDHQLALRFPCKL